MVKVSSSLSFLSVVVSGSSLYSAPWCCMPVSSVLAVAFPSAPPGQHTAISAVVSSRRVFSLSHLCIPHRSFMRLLCCERQQHMLDKTCPGKSATPPNDHAILFNTSAVSPPPLALQHPAPMSSKTRTHSSTSPRPRASTWVPSQPSTLV